MGEEGTVGGGVFGVLEGQQEGQGGVQGVLVEQEEPGLGGGGGGLGGEGGLGGLFGLPLSFLGLYQLVVSI